MRVLDCVTSAERILNIASSVVRNMHSVSSQQTYTNTYMNTIETHANTYKMYLNINELTQIHKSNAGKSQQMAFMGTGMLFPSYKQVADAS